MRSDPTAEQVLREALEEAASAAKQAVDEALVFDERRQAFWCRNCRYRPVFVGDTQLHADGCAIYRLHSLHDSAHAALARTKET